MAKYGEEKGEPAEKLSAKELKKRLKDLEKEMFDAATDLNFEKAAELRDVINKLKGEELGIDQTQKFFAYKAPKRTGRGGN